MVTKEEDERYAMLVERTAQAIQSDVMKKAMKELVTELNGEQNTQGAERMKQRCIEACEKLLSGHDRDANSDSVIEECIKAIKDLEVEG